MPRRSNASAAAFGMSRSTTISLISVIGAMTNGDAAFNFSAEARTIVFPRTCAECSFHVRFFQIASA